jgi:cellulose synthase/poly-beta-1,6-N-acetylglucosamine synthase-like glycosyltransferase
LLATSGVTIILLIAIAVLAYTYLGYPLVIAALARLARPRPAPTPAAEPSPALPTVTVCIPVHDGVLGIAAKIESVLRQDYPPEQMQVLVYSDGSTDGTDAIVADIAARDPRVHLIPRPLRRGKPTALNRMCQVAKGDVLVLTDARQPLSENAVRELVAPLADPEVACVAGTLVLSGSSGAGAYWRYERWIRSAEARFRGLVGVSGALYALRREDLGPVPEDLILDDVWIPMSVRLTGRRRIVAAPAAQAYDEAADDEREFHRKVRTLAGNYQLFAGLPRLLLPFANPSWFETFSHKLLRLVGPWALLALAVGTVAQLPSSRFALVLLAGQLGFYALALAGARAGKLGTLARTFVVLNAAALVGLWRFLTRTQRVTW